MNKEIIDFFNKNKNENIAQILRNHGNGIYDKIYGVKLTDLKKLAQKIKRNHILALELFESNILEAKYLAGYIIDNDLVNIDLINKWKISSDLLITTSTIPMIIASSKNRKSLLKDLFKDNPYDLTTIISYIHLISLLDDNELNIKEIKQLMDNLCDKIKNTDKDEEKKIYCNFILSAGIYIKELTNHALKCGELINNVELANVNKSCSLPNIEDKIKKCVSQNKIGIKRKKISC